MRKNYRNIKKKQLQTKVTLMVLTGGCIVSILLGLMLNLNGGPLKDVAGYIFIPMQEGINITGEWIFDTANDFRTLKDVLEENEALKKQVADLTSLNITTKLEQYELENLRELYELDAKYPTYEKVAASVIAKDSSNWFDTFTINRGTKHGIQKGMNVIAGGGLVGIVTDAGANYATVRSIINDTSNISAMIAATGDNFNVSGDLKTMNTEMAITFSQLRDEDNQVNVGDAVITSYVSDKYQQGILIGYISTIEDSANNLTKSGTITPIVDFAHLENVFVITKIKEVGTNISTEEANTQSTQTSETSEP